MDRSGTSGWTRPSCFVTSESAVCASLSEPRKTDTDTILASRPPSWKTRSRSRLKLSARHSKIDTSLIWWSCTTRGRKRGHAKGPRHRHCPAYGMQSTSTNSRNDLTARPSCSKAVMRPGGSLSRCAWRTTSLQTPMLHKRMVTVTGKDKDILRPGVARNRSTGMGLHLRTSIYPVDQGLHMGLRDI